MTEATRKVHGKSPDKRFALVRPLFQRGLKDDIHNHNAVIPAKADPVFASRQLGPGLRRDDDAF